MKVIIIEDESLVADDLASTLKQLRPGIEVMCILGSVKEAVAYFKKEEAPDLVFSDIQLGDGLSFEIAKQVEIKAPIIFCTAFDEYAIEAFKANGIEYVLKPFSNSSLEKAIVKFEQLKKLMAEELTRQYEVAMKTLVTYKLKSSETLMVRYRDRYLPINLDKIALFFLENEVYHLLTHSGKSYVIPESLEQLEEKTGLLFFRINRQFLVNRNAIHEAVEYFPRKLKVDLTIKFDKELFVSKEKKVKFLKWIAES